MAKTNPVQFAREVRQEASKVTWPTRREALISTSLVVLMALVAAVFFFGVDLVLAELVQLVLDRG